MELDAAHAPNRSYAFAAALFQELARAGLRHVCVCPGSRSAPLAAAAASGALRAWSHVDERSAGFFALGLAKASRAPVALVCTSGTAAVNLHPAVVEAFHARVPLLVLTADRPPELRDWGAGQTIDQRQLFGPHVRWFAEAPLPEATGPLLRHARALACRALAEAWSSPAGPVHLDLPFREPLEPRAVPGDVPTDLAARDPLAAAGRGDRVYTRLRPGVPAPAAQDLASLAERMGACERGVVACGPQDAGPRLVRALADLAGRLGWPLLAEPTSQLRRGPHVGSAPVLATADLLLRDDRFAAAHAPDFVLRVGDTPTSRSLRLWLERRPPGELVLVDPDGVWHDPSHLASEVLRVDPLSLCEELAARLPERGGGDSEWLRDFLAADRRASAAIEAHLAADDALLEARAVRELAGGLPEGTLLYVSNSMPVRDLDAFLPASARGMRVLCNRGASGIDGMLSSALGAAAANAGPVALLTGDLALLHDLGGLLAARRHGIPLAVVVLNNDGGGIFSFLPIADFGEQVAFEEHFRARHGLDLAGLCRGAGADFTRVSSWEHFRASLKEALAAPGACVIEVPVDNERNVAQFHALVGAVSAALHAPAGARGDPA